MGSRARLILVASVLAVGGAAAGLLAGGGGSPSATESPGAPDPTAWPVGTASPPPRCLPVPTKALDVPAWMPESLPMPEGGFVSEVPDAPGGALLVSWTVPVDLNAFVRYALAEWQDRQGWEIGRGDRESFEAEATMRNGELIAAFRASALYCDQSKVRVLIAMADPTTAAGSPTPTPDG